MTQEINIDDSIDIEREYRFGDPARAEGHDLYSQPDWSHFGLHDESDLRVLLLTGEYVPDPALDNVYADIAEYETTHPDYTVGGKRIENLVAVEYVDGSVAVTGDPVTWQTTSDVELTASYGVVYDAGSMNELLSYIDFGGQTTAYGGGILEIEWADAGIITMQPQ